MWNAAVTVLVAMRSPMTAIATAKEIAPVIEDEVDPNRVVFDKTVTEDEVDRNRVVLDKAVDRL